MIPELFSDTKTLQLVALIAGIITVWIAVMVIGTGISRRKKRKLMQDAASYVLLEVTQTAHAEGGTDGIEEIRLFEDVLASVVPEDAAITFEIAVPNDGTDIRFYLAVPSAYVETARNQIRRVFTRSEVKEVPDYTIFEKGGSTTLASVRLKEFYGLPVKTYAESGADTFASIVTAFAGAREEHAGMAMQLVLQRAAAGTVENIQQVIHGLKSGKKLRHLKPTNVADSVAGTLASLSEQSREERETGQDIQRMEKKSQGLLYQANIRIGVCTAKKEEAAMLFSTLKQRFAQFGPSGYNRFIFTEQTDKKTVLDFSFRLANASEAAILSAEEISSIFRLFNRGVEVTNLAREKTKHIAAPTDLAREGLLLGDNIFHGRKTPVYIPDEDRLRHIYIIGQTGTGKTALIKSMAHQDIQSGKGVCIIDPHGDLVDDMLAVVPEHRLDDVIIFDPSDTERTLALNMLEYDRNRPEEKTFIIDEILSIFHKLFSATPEGLGPVFEQYMRNSLLLLMEGKRGEPATLLDVPRVLTDEQFRASLLSNCGIEPVTRFWKEEAQNVEGEASLNNIAPYITSKFTGFISNDYVRPIISQPRSSFSFRQVMDEGRLLFIKLPQGKIGEINTGLLGMITAGKIALAAFSRDNIPPEERKDFYLYIDEFQNFTTDSIGKIFSEARKYRLGLTVANQVMAQLTDTVRGSVLGNVGTTVSFRVGIEDAEILAKKFAPAFSAPELAKIENLHCVIAMLSHSAPLEPFTMQIRFAPDGSGAVRDKIMRYASVKYGKESRVDSETSQPVMPEFLQ